MTIKTIRFTAVRQKYERLNPNGHWFDEGAMKFFKTKLPEEAYETLDGVMFVTRETGPSGVPAFTVRRQTDDGDIETVGEFNSYRTKDAATKAIRSMDAIARAKDQASSQELFSLLQKAELARALSGGSGS